MQDSSSQPTTDRDYRWFIEKFGLLITPAIAYYLAFTYESAYCRCFAIPAGFIHPDFTTILIYTSLVLGVGFFLAALMAPWIELVLAPPGTSATQHAVRLYAPVAFVLLITIINAKHWHLWSWWIIAIAVATVGDFVLALLGDKEQPYLARLRGPAAFFIGPGTMWHIAKQRLSLEVFAFLVAFYLARLISAGLGEAEALNQETFLVPSSYPDSVLVRVYGDKILCALIDMDSKRPLKRFYVVTAGADTTLHFETRKIGTLVFDD